VDSRAQFGSFKEDKTLVAPDGIRTLARNLVAIYRLRYHSSLRVCVCVQIYIHIYIVKLKCTLIQALRLSTGRTVHRGSRGTALLYRH
jgi:hypothetical protein